MIRINEHYSKLQAGYLFVEVARRIRRYEEAHPDASVIKLGIGDVTRPLPPAVVSAFEEAVREMGKVETFRGYGPEQGYEFLREAIAEHDYRRYGMDVSADEIFISDGAKNDVGNLQELFAPDIHVAVQDPVYPVYVDTNVMAGRTGPARNGRYEGLTYLHAGFENGFVPEPPDEEVDLIYLCFPNNPTGSVATHEQLTRWVEYARGNRAVILFDAAYVAFIRDAGLPRSIFEIEGAREVAIEFRSFSKDAGFTGTRCAFTVIPKDVTAYDSTGTACSVHPLWNRRHSTKFNGVSYPVQRAAAAVYTEAGIRETRELADFYLENARIIRDGLDTIGLRYTGGTNSPYIWAHGGGRDSWELFDMLLHEASVVTTPGAGFGTGGDGFIRISAFNSRENVEEAMARISKALG
ncbi:MAG: LL-diaminopimelate aminotransferase [Spirochaetaceae bacterium]